jgi:hypothetical protein
MDNFQIYLMPEKPTDISGHLNIGNIRHRRLLSDIGKKNILDLKLSFRYQKGPNIDIIIHSYIKIFL